MSGKDTQLCNSFQCTLDVGRVCVCVCVLLSVVSDFFATLWAATCQAPLSVEFSRREYWSGLCFPSPGVRGQIWVSSSAGRFFTTCATREARSEDRSYYHLYGYEVALLSLFKRHYFPYELLCAFIINKFKVSVQACFCSNDLFVSTLVPHTLNHYGFRVSLIFK